jgi:hypothetical protein
MRSTEAVGMWFNNNSLPGSRSFIGFTDRPAFRFLRIIALLSPLYQSINNLIEKYFRFFVINSNQGILY